MTITITPFLVVLIGALVPAFAWFAHQLYTIKQSLKQHRGHADTLYGRENRNGIRDHRTGLVARHEEHETRIQQLEEIARPELTGTGRHKTMTAASPDSDPPDE